MELKQGGEGKSGEKGRKDKVPLQEVNLASLAICSGNSSRNHISIIILVRILHQTKKAINITWLMKCVIKITKELVVLSR